MLMSAGANGAGIKVRWADGRGGDAITWRADGNNVGRELKKSSVKLRVVSFKILLIDRGNFKAWQRFCGSRIRKHSGVLFKEKCTCTQLNPVY